MSFDIQDLLDDYPEMENFDIDELQDLDEFELQEIIDQFDSTDKVPKLGRNLKDVIKELDKIDFKQDKESVKNKYGLTEKEYQVANDMKTKILEVENRAKKSSSDTGTKALNDGTITNVGDTDRFTAVFVTEEDEKVCPICKPLEGNEYKIDPETRILIDAPLLPDDTHINCRCRYLLKDGSGSSGVIGGSGYIPDIIPED